MHTPMGQCGRRRGHSSQLSVVVPAMSGSRASGSRDDRPKADDSGQQPADAHVAAGQPDAGEEKPKAGRFGEDTDVGRRGQDGPRARRDAVDRGDHRLRNLAKVADACAGHPRELVDIACAPLDQLADDLVDIAAGTEAAPLASEDQYADVLATSQRVGEVADVRVDLKRKGVEPIRPREGERRDAVTLVVLEVLPTLHVGRTATASISISASGSKSEVTSINVDAG